MSFIVMTEKNINVTEWTSSGKTFKIGDVVTHINPKSMGRFNNRVVTSIKVCAAGDGHVVLDNDPMTLTDFFYMELDKSYYRDKKLEELGI